jgi:hypothetical protein
MSYATLAQLKEYGGIGDTADDALLTRLLASAQAMIDAYCHQSFEALADSTRYFDPLCDAGGRTLYVDAPLCAITSVTNGDGVVVAPTNYVTEPRNLTPWFALSLKQSSSVLWTYSSSPENSIAIVGRWAHSIAAPADIVQVTIRLAHYLYRQKATSVDLDRAMSLGAGVLLPAELPRDIKTLLEPYKRIVTS